LLVELVETIWSRTKDDLDKLDQRYHIFSLQRRSQNKNMKNDPIVNALINFLVPIIFLYALFFLAEFFSEGFFAFIYSAALFLAGFMVLSVRSSNDAKIISFSWLEFVSFFISLLLLTYLIAILLIVTDLFAL